MYKREYVTDIDSETARKSIQALGGIALRIPKMATPIVKQLCNFLNYQQSHIINETLIVFQGKLKVSLPFIKLFKKRYFEKA